MPPRGNGRSLQENDQITYALTALGILVAGLSIVQSFNPVILTVEDKGYLDRCFGQGAVDSANQLDYH